MCDGKVVLLVVYGDEAWAIGKKVQKKVDML